jgi:hypothetical protein
MREFIETLYTRNESLFIFGALNFALALIFIVLSRTTTIEVMGVNAWYKPIKFALSIGIYSWTMGWFTHYLGQSQGITVFNWIVIIMLGFEIIYIGLQAGRGQLSHFNLTHPLYANLYVLMAAAATIVSLATAYIGWAFIQRDFPGLPDYYIWAIRIGIILFVIFSLEGFVMGSRMSHTIGGPDGGEGLPILNWSYKYGDPRIAHFIGMHALQVLPILSYYLLKNVKVTVGVGLAYGLLAVFTLIQALQAKPFYKF